MIKKLFEGLPVLMASGIGGVYFYKANGVSFWSAFIFVGIYDILVALFVFFAAGWLKRLRYVERFLAFLQAKREKSKVLNSNSPVFYPSKKFYLWLQKKKAWVVLGCNLFLGWISGIGQTTIVVAKLFDIRFALPGIIFNTLLREFVVFLILYHYH